MIRLRARLADDRGAVALITALLMVVLLGAVAMVTDIARLTHERQVIQNALDFGALAGANSLPVSTAAASGVIADIAKDQTVRNYPDLVRADVNVAFRCVVGDRDADGLPDAVDLGAVCGPRPGVTWFSGWSSAGGKVSHACEPELSDLCNAVTVETSRTIGTTFGQALGVSNASTGPIEAASCRGSCGNAKSSLDVVMVFDRTASMTPTDLANAKNGALSVLQVYDASTQWVGLVGLPYHNPSDRCQVNPIQVYPNPGPVWRLVGISNDYRHADGTLNNSSQLVSTINCLQLPGALNVTPSGGGHTDLGDPLEEAATMLRTEGRANVPDVLIFFTDGEANQPRGSQPCSYFYDRAQTAKASGIDIYTIGYGVASARCGEDTSGRYVGKFASTVLADVATTSIDSAPGACTPAENIDKDNYFCEAGTGDLEPVFRAVAEQSLATPRLIAI